MELSPLAVSDKDWIQVPIDSDDLGRAGYVRSRCGRQHGLQQ